MRLLLAIGIDIALMLLVILVIQLWYLYGDR